MPITPEQQAQIDEQRADPRPTLRAVSEGMERHLYRAHEVLDHGLVRVIDTWATMRRSPRPRA